MSEASNPVLAVVSRGGLRESLHRGVVAAVRDGALVYAAGDADAPQFWRSSAKPFQALAALDAMDAAGFAPTDAELALMASSHGGSPSQVAVVEGLLARAGVPVDALRCGAHAPYDGPSASALARDGRRPSPLHHNCSGKHAGMLVAAKLRGASLEDYLAPAHPVQVACRATLARFAGVAPDAVGVAVDGCSAPTFVLPARSAASAFAALAVSDEAGPRRLRAAVSASPVLYAGNGRTCTKLLAAFDGGVYPKSGAEGFYALGVRDARLGLALKIDDGAQRATEALVATLLLRLLPDLPSKTRSALEAMRRTPVRNAAGLTVGAIEATPP